MCAAVEGLDEVDKQGVDGLALFKQFREPLRPYWRLQAVGQDCGQLGGAHLTDELALLG